MPNLSTDALFILLKSLERAEKRNFKLYVTRNSASTDLKIIQLFDALDKMKEYDEEELLRKNSLFFHFQLSIFHSLKLLRQIFPITFRNPLNMEFHVFSFRNSCFYKVTLPKCLVFFLFLVMELFRISEILQLRRIRREEMNFF